MALRREICYFSGTGTSLAVARDIAQRINGNLISITSKLSQEKVTIDADVLGIVFPVYNASTGASGIPHIVQRFIHSAVDLAGKYVFAVATHRGGPGLTMENLARLIWSRGGMLAGGFTVQLSTPYSPNQKIGHILFNKQLESNIRRDTETQKHLLRVWKNKLNNIQEYVLLHQRGTLETEGKVAKTILTPWFAVQGWMASARYRSLSGGLRAPLEYLVPFADQSFIVNERCIGCGICADVCPVDNIVIVKHRPEWQHHCETCFACFQWCPNNAIGGSIIEYEKPYRHPGITLKDMLTVKQGPKNKIQDRELLLFGT